MDKYQTYALNKAKIKDLQDECKKIEEEILPEVKKAGEPVKRDYGVFMIVSKKSFTYSERLTSKIEEIEKLKDIEEINGKATVTEKESFRFTPSKYAMPKGTQTFEQTKPMGKLSFIKN